MWHKKMTYMKIKNDVDNSVDSVENVTRYSVYFNASYINVHKKENVILVVMSKNIKSNWILRKYIDKDDWDIIYYIYNDTIRYIIL